jgi:hypothetical protein
LAEWSVRAPAPPPATGRRRCTGITGCRSYRSDPAFRTSNGAGRFP